MATIPVVEPFSKATVSRDAVEQERRNRLLINGAIASVITESPENWILTTTFRVADPAPMSVQPVASPVSIALGGPSGFGVDSLNPFNAGMLSTVVSKHGVQSPLFWGRYFHAPGRINAQGNLDDGLYTKAENAPLHARGIRVLPIARQTAHVADSASVGTRHAEANVAAIFEVFPPEFLAAADPDVILFLDVEEAQNQPRLSPAYYDAWARRVEEVGMEASGGKVSIRPAIYTSQGANETFRVLVAAIAEGAPCFGIWTARNFEHNGPTAFSPHMIPTVPLPVPVLLCQYFESADGAPTNENLDMNVCNPAHQDMLLSRLIMPPAL